MRAATGTTSVRLSKEGVQRVREVAEANGMTLRAYMHALMNYAISTHNRPGSWEGSSPFDLYNYIQVEDADGVPVSGFADRWFS